MNQYHRNLEIVLKRYADMAQEHREAELLCFIIEFEQALKSNMPLMKMNRWMGYIQGVLICKGYTDVTTERDFTRPYFRPLDFEQNGLRQRIMRAIKSLWQRK